MALTVAHGSNAQALGKDITSPPRVIHP